MRALQQLAPPLLGSCLCGDFSYVCSSTPVWSVNCHCRCCQKLSGAPWVSAFAMPAEHFAFTGDVHPFHRLADSGAKVTTSHCARCGARMFAQSSGNPAHVNIFATTLDDPSAFKAVSNVYLSEAAPWIDPPPARYNFQKMPVRPDE